MIQADVLPIIEVIFNFVRDLLNLMFQFKIVFGLSLLEILLAMFILSILWNFVKMGDDKKFNTFSTRMSRTENQLDKNNQKNSIYRGVK